MDKMQKNIEKMQIIIENANNHTKNRQLPGSPQKKQTQQLPGSPKKQTQQLPGSKKLMRSTGCPFK